MPNFRTIIEILKQSGAGFSEDKVLTLGAALAYYTIFSIAPLLIISIAIAGWAFGAEASKGEIYAQIAGLVGESGAQSIQAMVESASNEPSTGFFSSIIGLIVMLLGAAGVFGQLQDSLNLIWRVQPVPGRSLATIVRQRLLSLSLVMVVAFLLLISLLASAALSAVGKYFEFILPAGSLPWQILNFLTSFLVITFLFAAIYKILPDVTLSWGDVWHGAFFTSLLFTLGKFLIGLYLGRGSVTSSFGAAGSLVGVIIWVYYSSALILFGAELTRAYVRQIGHQVVPKAHCELRPELESAKAQKAPVHAHA